MSGVKNLVQAKTKGVKNITNADLKAAATKPMAKSMPKKGK